MSNKQFSIILLFNAIFILIIGSVYPITINLSSILIGIVIGLIIGYLIRGSIKREFKSSNFLKTYLIIITIYGIIAFTYFICFILFNTYGYKAAYFLNKVHLDNLEVLIMVAGFVFTVIGFYLALVQLYSKKD